MLATKFLDCYLSRAIKLIYITPKSGPCHAQNYGRKARTLAYKYRSQARKTSEGCKTQVRFSNKCEGLVLAIRRGKDENWDFYEADRLPRLPDDKANDSEDLSEADDD